MTRGPRIGVIRPRLGFTFENSAPYPPPSAHLNSPPKKKMKRDSVKPKKLKTNSPQMYLPSTLSAFGKPFASLNCRIAELHGSTQRKAISLSLEITISILNEMLEKETAEVDRLHHGKHYKEFLKIIDKYDTYIATMVKLCEAGNMNGLIAHSNKIKVDLRALLYKKGVYIQDEQKKKSLFKGKHPEKRTEKAPVRRHDIKKMLEQATARKR